eukprot:COSAG05_NODE_2444_length_3058_cov_13.939500_4_plen_125_part_01
MTRQFAHRACRVHERQDGAVVAAQEGFALHVHRPHDACARSAAREQASIRAHVALLVGGLAANIVNRLHDDGELCPRGAGRRVRWGRWGRGARQTTRGANGVEQARGGASARPGSAVEHVAHIRD